MLTMYGIKNCDTVKKARRWLESRQIDYQFHDYRTDGTDPEFLQRVISELGWNALLNTRGTTWRKLDEARRSAVTDAPSAIALMLEMPALIKRPLLCSTDKPALSGFTEASYQDYCTKE